MERQIFMLTKTPFLTGFSTLLCGRSKRKMQEVLAAERQEICEKCPDGLSEQLSFEISPKLLSAHSTTQRDRTYPNEVTFWAFLGQVFSDDGSCSRAVARVQEWMRSKKMPLPSSSTSSYTAARQALPIEMLQAVHCSLCDQLDSNLSKDDFWRGFRVKAADGTSAQMPDSPANQEAYPQPSSQAPGCGFPVIGLVGLIDLSHGGLRDFSQSNVETGEMRGYDQLESYLTGGDLLVADRLYSSYEVIARLKAKGVEFIGRNHQARKMDFRQGRKVGPNQRVHVWKKPRRQPALSRLSTQEWEGLPTWLEMRVIRTKGPDREGKRRVRYVVTTLLDAAKYPWEEVASLYLHRWEIELRFRDIKTTMSMEMLRTKSPEMVRKEVLMHLIAYNVVRLLMLKAGKANGVNHRRISFKGVIQVLEESRIGFEKALGKARLLAAEKDNLWTRIAERVVVERPGRSEPRKKKRRPKSYGWMQQPRHTFFEHFKNEIPPRKILDEMA
jgi:hypothetical protein